MTDQRLRYANLVVRSAIRAYSRKAAALELMKAMNEAVLIIGIFALALAWLVILQ